MREIDYVPETWFVVDVESDGPCPGLYSMVSFAAVRLDRALTTTFLGVCAPLHGASYTEEALAVSGTTREQHLRNPPAGFAIRHFYNWVIELCQPGTKAVFVSDNLAFDWQFINYYFHRFANTNPFGHTGRRIGDLWSGLRKETSSSGWKMLRKRELTHHPLDDARNNAEALITLADAYGLYLPGL